MNDYCIMISKTTQREVKTAVSVFTQDIGGPVARYEARIVPVAHALLQDALSEILAKAAARRDQLVIPAVGLRESAQDGPGHDPSIREYR